MLVSVIIVNYKDYETTGECLESLESTTYPRYEVIVVDNESDEGQLGRLRTRFQSFRFIPSRENLYYAGGNNLGIEHANGDLIVLLNNDTKVAAGWLEPLVERAQERPMAFYQPKILFMDRPETINSMGNTMNVFGFSFPLGINEKDDGRSEEQEVFYCSGACVAASRQVIEAAGMLDSDFYNYYEDVNWGWRGRLIGIKSFVVPRSVVYHKWGGSYTNVLSARKLFFLERGRKASVLRNFSPRTILVLAPSIFLIDLALALYCAKKGMLGSKLAAEVDVCKNLGMIMKERKRIQSARKAGDGDILSFVSRKISHPYFDSAPAAKKMLDALSGICHRMLG
jgi:hypothetical protein